MNAEIAATSGIVFSEDLSFSLGNSTLGFASTTGIEFEDFSAATLILQSWFSKHYERSHLNIEISTSLLKTHLIKLRMPLECCSLLPIRPLQMKARSGNNQQI